MCVCVCACVYVCVHVCVCVHMQIIKDERRNSERVTEKNQSPLGLNPGPSYYYSDALTH